MKFKDELLNLSGRNVKIARIISRLTLAPLVNLYVGAIISFASPISLGPILTPLTSFLICIILMVILPVAPIILEAWRGKIDLDVSEQEVRPKFFGFALLCYAFASVIYWILKCDVMLALAASYFAVTFGVMIATFYSKVSVHAAGIGGPGTALLIVYGIIALPVVLIWIAVVWSRKTLQQHSVKQSIVGILIGISITMITYVLLYPNWVFLSP